MYIVPLILAQELFLLNVSTRTFHLLQSQIIFSVASYWGVNITFGIQDSNDGVLAQYARKTIDNIFIRSICCFTQRLVKAHSSFDMDTVLTK